MNQKELEEEARLDQKREWIEEGIMTHYDDWKDDCINQLREDFIEIYEKEFEDYCAEQYSKEKN